MNEARDAELDAIRLQRLDDLIQLREHAGKLAEACQMFLTALNKDQLNHAYAFTQKALAAYEEAQ